MGIIKLFTIASLLFSPVTAIICKVLSFSGGGSHGAFEAGVYTKICNNCKYDIVTGVSAGSLNAAYATKSDNVSGLKEQWKNFRNDNVYYFSPTKESIYNNDPLKEKLKYILDDLPKRNRNKILIGSTNLRTGKYDIFETISVDTLIASSSIPIIFPPHFINGSYYIDGGIQIDEILFSAVDWCIKNVGEEVIVDMIISYQEVIEDDRKEWDIFSLFSRVIDIVHVDFDDVTSVLSSTCTGSIIAKVNIYIPKNKFQWNIMDFDHGEEIFNIGMNNYSLEQLYYCS